CWTLFWRVPEKELCMFIKYLLSKAYSDRVWIETGKRRQDLHVTLEIPDEVLTPEQRKMAIDNQDGLTKGEVTVTLHAYKLNPHRTGPFGGLTNGPMQVAAEFDHEL